MATAVSVAGLRVDERNRAVDLVRASALLAVVLGHWLKQGWYVDDGGLHRAGLLGIAPWTHPLTWVFQVIPLFFVVGGYVNALSWRHARTRGLGYGTWLAGRAGRLTRPLLPLLVFWAVVVPLAPLVGLGDDWVRIGSKAALLPTWFLATYLVIVALVPITLGAWERWGVWTLAVGAAALLVDVACFASGSSVLGALNMFLVWGVLHQAGFAWRDGALTGRTRPLLLLVGSLLGALVLVRFGPYGVSMVGVNGYGANNTNPPRSTLLCLGLAMVGAAVLLEPVLTRVAARPLVWAAVVRLDVRMMTVYLWHLTALCVLGALSLGAGGWGLHARPDSASWWAWRPAWLAALTVVTVLIVWTVGRFEDAVATAPVRSAVLPVAEVVLTVVALALLADDGLRALDVAPFGWAVLVATLAALVTIDRSLRPQRRQFRYWNRS